MGNTRSLKSTTEERITIVHSMLLEGYTRAQILRAGKEWQVSARAIDEYIAKARADILETTKEEREDNRAKILSNLWDLFRKTNSRAEYADAHKILMSIAKINGLEEQTINHFVSERPLQAMPTQDLRALADKLSSGKH